jgi:hypothetical protein
MQKTFWEHTGNMQRTFREHAGNIQRTSGEKKLREHAETLQLSSR